MGFESEGAYEQFTKDDFQFGADVQAVVFEAAVGANVSSFDGKIDAQAGLGITGDDITIETTSSTTMYTKGFAVFTTAEAGFFTEASFSGQIFKFKPLS